MSGHVKPLQHYIKNPALLDNQIAELKNKNNNIFRSDNLIKA